MHKQGVLILVAMALGAVALVLMRPLGTGPEVAVYTSVDSEYAQTLAARFEKETGIRVALRTDAEISKTTGMIERLRELKERPDGDVFWNSELSGTLLLAREDVLAPYASPAAESIPEHFKDPAGIWTGFGLRARVIIYNTNRLKAEEAPKTLEELTDPKWRGRFCIARPLFGTTRSHLVSLVVALGEEKGFDLLRRIRDNAQGDGKKRWVVDGNAAVRDRVAEGYFDFGLTDTDDVYSALDRNRPVDQVFFEQAPSMGWNGVYLIPNNVSLIKGGPNPENARKFVDFLLKPETEAWLAEQGARQIPVRKDVPVPEGYPTMSSFEPAIVDLAALEKGIEPISDRIDKLFRGIEE